MAEDSREQIAQELHKRVTDLIEEREALMDMLAKLGFAVTETLRRQKMLDTSDEKQAELLTAIETTLDMMAKAASGAVAALRAKDNYDGK